MATEPALISVIIPVYNRDRYLAEAIDSVLAQTYPSIELLIVDDGSTDRSAEIAQQYSLCYHFQPNAGISAARNTGVSLAKGEFLAFLDSDDIWVSDKLTKQMAAFAADLTLEAVFGYAQQFYSPELDAALRQQIRCPEEPLAAHLPTAMLIKRSSFDRIGQFNPTLKVGGDISWYITALEQNLRQVTLPDVVYYRRLHDKNNGTIAREHTNERFHLLKAKIDRQRAARNLAQD
jgi:glycosyltransferase involved in cell wall biosynthesis